MRLTQETRATTYRAIYIYIGTYGREFNLRQGLRRRRWYNDNDCMIIIIYRETYLPELCPSCVCTACFSSSVRRAWRISLPAARAGSARSTPCWRVCFWSLRTWVRLFRKNKIIIMIVKKTSAIIRNAHDYGFQSRFTHTRARSRSDHKSTHGVKSRTGSARYPNIIA